MAHPRTSLVNHAGVYSALTLLPLLALPFLQGSCTKVACFQWTEAEGACPSQEEALKFFQNPSCPNHVRGVDSAPQFDGEFCCYEVSTIDAGDETCGEGVGGAQSTTMAVGAGPSPSGPGPSPGCFGCVDVVFSGGQPPCPGSITILNALNTCACAGPCQSSCFDNLCQSPGAFDDICINCLNDFDFGCGKEFNECINDFGQVPPPEG